MAISKQSSSSWKARLLSFCSLVIFLQHVQAAGGSNLRNDIHRTGRQNHTTVVTSMYPRSTTSLRRRTSDSDPLTKYTTHDINESWTKLGRVHVETRSNLHDRPGRTVISIANGSLADLGNKSLRNVEFTFRAKMDFTNEATDDASNEGALQIWGAIRVKDGENRYVVGLRGAPEPQVSFARYAPDNEALFMGFSPIDPIPDPEAWHTVRLVAIENRFLVFLNDEELPRIDIEDPEPLWDEGAVAIGGGWLPVFYENVQVMPLSEDRAKGILRSIAVLSQETTDNNLVTLQNHQEEQRQKERSAYSPAAIDALPDVRGDFHLDGRWLFMPEQFLDGGEGPSHEQFADEGWHTIDVPSFWTPSLTWLYGEGGMPNLEGLQSNRGPSDKIRVEALDRVNAQTFPWEETQVGWYRHYIDLPEESELDKKDFTLEFGAIAKISKIWVNGVAVGENIGMFGMVQADIGKALKPGRNVIAVRVVGTIPDEIEDDHEDNNIEFVAVTVEVTTKMMNSLPRGMVREEPSGIWQPVKLVVTSKTRVDDVHIVPGLDNAEMSVSLLTSQSQDSTVSVGYRIVDARSNEILTSGDPVAITIPSGEASSVVMQTPTVQPKLWTPHEPNLYVLELTITQDGEIIDQHNTRFGFRTFTIDDGRILLNGKPYWLRGGNHVPSSLDPNNAELARRFIELSRDGNVFMTRGHGIPFTEAFLDAADELGLGISFEGTWPWMLTTGPIPSESLLKIWKDEFASLIHRHRNRPSLLMWCVNNEMKYMKYEKDATALKEKWDVISGMISTMRDIDPTRPIVSSSGYVRKRNTFSTREVVVPFGVDDGDFDDVHHYYGWYGHSAFHFFNGEFGDEATPGRPFISQELSTGYPRNDGWASRYYQFTRYVPQASVGQYAYEQNDPNIWLNRQSFLTKELVETIRRTNRDNVHGLMMFAYLTWFQDGWKADKIRPMKTYFELKKAMEPVLISAELYGRHFYAGTTNNRRICIINDSETTQDFSSGSLRWRLVNGKQVLSEGTLETPPVAYYSNVWGEINFEVPEILPSPRVDAQLVLEYTVDGAFVSRNTYDILLASREWSYGSPSDSTIQIFDPKNDLGSLLDQWEATYVLGHNLDVTKPLVIAGDLSRFSRRAGGIDPLLQYVKEGGVAVLNQPGDSLAEYFPEHIKGYRKTQGEIVSLAIPESPLFEGIEPLDLSWFEMGEARMPYACSGTWQINRQNADVVAPAHQCDFHTRATKENLYEMAGAPIVEIRLGEGIIIASEMMLSTHEEDPVAARLLRNIISFASTSIASENDPISIAQPWKNPSYLDPITFDGADDAEPECSGKSVLKSQERLYSSKKPNVICSPDGKYRFGFATDGELAIWHADKRIWSAGEDCVGRATYLVMQKGGRLVLNIASSENEAEHEICWATHTEHTSDKIPDSVLQLDNSGRASIVSPYGDVIWSTESAATDTE